ncbi:aminotransferase class-III [Rhizoclosmatium globosum]|uniref:Aminotransferase class-III n=1 Tax=Rhizoclosmatium globosum TaxID=329046 RepID=A0A1Y2CW39_9FUNG|nr:aminotransferase class-III [Rhizoclosmatium globosum]|eukprot:ORY51243.1 aminotransferase class-III [Rhizoclosmatium globosum]
MHRTLRLFSTTTAQGPPNVFTHGQGAVLVDAAHNKFLDFNSGIAVNALGHNHPDVVRTIEDQAAKLIHLSNLYANEYAETCAQKLVDGVTDKDAGREAWWGDAAKVFFCNSGTEANEAALKFARKQARIRNPENPATQFLSFTNAFHGRSMVSGSFAPLVPGFVTSPYNDVAALDQVDWSQICGVIVEPLQGEGGVFPATPQFLKAVREKCDSVGATLIYDEIQCGLGRTAKLFCHHHQPPAISPDLLTLAKPLANGLPIGAVLLRHTIAQNIKPGDHGTTFGGSPLATRVASVVLDKIADPAFLAHVSTVSKLLFSRLNKLCQEYPKILKEVRGKGLLVGLQLQGGAEASNAGLNTVRMAPPLIISVEEVEQACKVFEVVAKEMNSQ